MAGRYRKSFFAGLVIIFFFLAEIAPVSFGLGCLAEAKKPDAIVPYGGYHPLTAKKALLPNAAVTQPEAASIITIGQTPLLFINLDEHGRLKWTPYIALSSPSVKSSALPGWSELTLTAAQREGRYTLGYFPIKPLAPFSAKAYEASLLNVAIRSDVYWQQMESSLTGLLFHRSGKSIGSRAYGLQVYAGHLNDAEPSPQAKLLDDQIRGTLNLTGGWYEGSSYTKSLKTNAVVAMRLLGLYGMNRERLQRLSTPLTIRRRSTEEDAGAGALLQELRFGLDWLQAMQLEKGAFLSKVSGENAVSPYTAPSLDNQGRYYYPPETESSLLAIAALAKAGTVLAEDDVSYAVFCLRAAEKGWIALGEKVSDTVASRQPDLAQARLLALLELWIATDKPGYETAFYQQLDTFYPLIQDKQSDLSWALQEVITTYAQRVPLAKQRPEVLSFMDMALLGRASRYHLLASVHPWQIPASAEEALNMVDLLERGNVLLRAYQRRQEPILRQAAAQTYAYVMGLNPWRQAFVTEPLHEEAATAEGVTKKASKKNESTAIPEEPKPSALWQASQPQVIDYPCHPLSQSAKRSIPGLLVTGLNSQALQEAPLPKVLDSDSQCLTNRADLLTLTTLLLNAGFLNEAFNPEASDADVPQVYRDGSQRYTLPEIN